MDKLPNGLNETDMLQFLRTLNSKNQNSLIKVLPEEIKSVKKVGEGFMAQLITGESFLLNPVSESYLNVQASVANARNQGSRGLMVQQSESTKEGREAIKTVKAMKVLKEQGVDITGFSPQEMVEAKEAIDVFSNRSSGSTSDLSNEEKRIAQDFLDIWNK